MYVPSGVTQVKRSKARVWVGNPIKMAAADDLKPRYPVDPQQSPLPLPSNYTILSGNGLVRG